MHRHPGPGRVLCLRRMTVHAFDPGEHTGYAQWDGKRFLAWEINTARGVFNVLSTIKAGDEVYYENFTIRPGVRTHQPGALHIIGAIKYRLDRLVLPDVGFEPATAKGLVSNEDLRALSFYSGSALRHANDAARVLVAAGLTGASEGMAWVKEALRAADQS